MSQQFANNCLDRAQAIFPRAFEIHADEVRSQSCFQQRASGMLTDPVVLNGASQLFAQARKPADQAYEIFQQRVAASQMVCG